MAVALNHQGLLDWLRTPEGFLAVSTQFAEYAIAWPNPANTLWDEASIRMGCRWFKFAVSASGYPQPRVAVPGQGPGQSARYYSQRMWSSYNAGRVLLPEEEGSHLCWNKRCINASHVCAETGECNKSRDTCRLFLLNENFDRSNFYRCCHRPACLFAVLKANGQAAPNTFHAYP